MCSACCGLLCLLTLGCHSASWRRIHRPHRSCCTPPIATRAPSLRPHSEARYRTQHTPPGSTTGRAEAEIQTQGMGFYYCAQGLNHFFKTTLQRPQLRLAITRNLSQHRKCKCQVYGFPTVMSSQ